MFIKNEKDKSLQVVYPDIAKEWHPTKNGRVSPYMVSPNSNKRVWWLGKCSHEWQATVASRTIGNGCPVCSGKQVLVGENDLLSINPLLAGEWHPTKNGDLLPNMVTPNSHKKVWWLGKCGHEWQATIAHRSNGRDCPVCSNRKVLKGYNDLKTTDPDLATEWHPKKNQGLTPEMFTQKSKKKVWWLGECGHEWQASIKNRSNGTSCPICSNHQVLTGYNDLETIAPDIAKEWHPTKNGILKPSEVSRSSAKKVWWLGSCGHEWQAKVYLRTSSHGCPYCSNKKILSGLNDLETVNPALAAEWHPTKNGDLLASQVAPKSSKKVWWLCKNGHEWQASIDDRARGTGCPKCRNDK